MAVRRRIVLSLIALAPLMGQRYELGPDSVRRAGVAQGSVAKYSWTSRIYPGTTRDFWLYVPAQYPSTRPAALMVFLDGGKFVADEGSFHAPIVLDNLIGRGAMPVTIGVFIDPGVLPARVGKEAAHNNRSFEYDAVTDRFTRFLLEEILPEASKHCRFSDDPNDHAIGGSSSGGIAAFTVAWNRPDMFRRVLSFVGSYTNLRGGETYPSLIRKSEPKPIRVFLQDGEEDLNVAAGNWFIGAQDMASALEYGGYDVTHVWGVEGHDSKQGASILPDALRWLWRDYPAKIPKPSGGHGERQWSVLLTAPGQDWTAVSQVDAPADGLAADREGNVFFSDCRNGRIVRLGIDGNTSVFKEDSGGACGLSVGPDGRLYAVQTRLKRIVAYSMSGSETIIATGVNANDLTVSAHGGLYYTDPASKQVWSIDLRGKRMAYGGIESPTGLSLSPGHGFLGVDDSAGREVWWFQVQPDGSLANGDSTYRLETTDDFQAAGAGGMAMDTESFLYVATPMGIQVFDAPGRVMAILASPPFAPVTRLVFGGAHRDVLFATAGHRMFSRVMRRRGAAPWDAAGHAIP